MSKTTVYTLQKDIEALIYYGGSNDETGELFFNTCKICKDLFYGGYYKYALLMYECAKEQADFSKKWCEENNPEGLEEQENGEW